MKTLKYNVEKANNEKEPLEVMEALGYNIGIYLGDKDIGYFIFEVDKFIFPLPDYLTITRDDDV